MKMPTQKPVKPVPVKVAPKPVVVKPTPLPKPVIPPKPAPLRVTKPTPPPKPLPKPVMPKPVVVKPKPPVKAVKPLPFSGMPNQQIGIGNSEGEYRETPPAPQPAPAPAPTPVKPPAPPAYSESTGADGFTYGTQEAPNMNAPENPPQPQYKRGGHVKRKPQRW